MVCVFSVVAMAIVCFQIIRRVLPWLYMNVIGPKFLGPTVDLRRMGEWAVVTGATDGIGKAYAKALAKKGLNLVLISRSPEKLQTVAGEIKSAFKVEIQTIDVDFTGGQEIYEKIRTKLEGLDIGVLVNNVGISYPYPEYFLDTVSQKPQFLRDIIAANVHSVTHMTAVVMPRMVAKKKGVIINISSTAAVVPNPLLSVYSGTKAFIDKFSIDLQTEYKSNGIIIQSVQPGFVATNMAKMRKTSMLVPSADTFVESAIRTIGISNVTAGYLPHACLQLAIHMASCLLGDNMAHNIVFKHLLSLRRRALLHQAKKQ